MKVIETKIEKVKPYGNNPRKNAAAVEIVAKSISAYGFNSPIVVDKDYVVINGHTRLLAAKLLGLSTVPVVVAADLSAERVKAYRIMDNKSSEYADWDDAKLLTEIVELLNTDSFDLGIEYTGFDAEQLNKQLGLVLEQKPKKVAGKNGDIEFTAELLESHNYVVLVFDNDLDWQVAKERLNIRTVKSIRADEGIASKGIGRVIMGKEVIDRLDS